MANAYRQKLRKWPKIQNHDCAGLRNFSDYLNSVLVAKESNRSLSILDDEHENRALLYKIPDSCYSRWCRQVAQNMARGYPYPSFSDFCEFICIEADVVNNPITSIRSLDQGSGNRNRSNNFQSKSSPDFRPQSQNRTSETFANRPRYSNAVTVPQHYDQTARSPSCFYCAQQHVLSNCQSFTSLTLNDRREFCKTQRLCFGCLRHGHSNRDCRNRMRCETCNRQHPTVLHDDNWQTRQNYSNVPPLMPPLQTDRPPRSYFEASCPVQF